MHSGGVQPRERPGGTALVLWANRSVLARQCCGLSSITLKGGKSEYENILQKVGRLSSYRQAAQDFAALLKPILRRFIQRFEDLTHENVLDFCNRILHHHKGSGLDYHTGWMTAFCF